jgi:bifunctional DNA-binding transcriptional regulator/antitoxin component of YhaV-PrlF toxin-antitoxin module
MLSVMVNDTGQIMIPETITKKLGITKGMELCIIKKRGVYILKPTPLQAFKEILRILDGEAEKLGWKSEEDATEYFNEFRRERKKLNENND